MQPSCSPARTTGQRKQQQQNAFRHSALRRMHCVHGMTAMRVRVQPIACMMHSERSTSIGKGRPMQICCMLGRSSGPLSAFDIGCAVGHGPIMDPCPYDRRTTVWPSYGSKVASAGGGGDGQLFYVMPWAHGAHGAAAAGRQGACRACAPDPAARARQHACMHD